MLLVEFSVAVQQEDWEEVLHKIDKYGIVPTFSEQYEHAIWGDKEAILIDCLGPMDRVKMLCDDLHNETTYQTILVI